MRYAIFSVSDYKGGELHSNTNLRYDAFINELVELFGGLELDSVGDVDGDYSEYAHNEVRKYMKRRDFYSTYAGGGGFCGEMFKIEDDRMRSTSIEEHLDAIVDKIIRNPSR